MANTLILNNIPYILNQAENIWEWFGSSKVGEYTHYHLLIVFHKEDGFYAADKDDLSRGCYV